MATFQLRIEGRVGESVGGDTGFTAVQLQDAFDHGLRTVISALPEPAWKFFGESKVDFSPLIGASLTSSKIIKVLRRDGVIWRKCQEIDSDMAGAAADVKSLHYASAFTPNYFVDSGDYSNPKVKVLPEGNGDAARLVTVAIPTVDITTDTIIPHFPDELEELPELSSVIWVKEREMGFSRRDSQTEIEAITDSGILTALATTYTGIGTALAAITTGLGDASIGTALAAITTAYDRINPAVIEASTEFDKVPLILDSASDEFDKISALLDKGEIDSEIAVDTALAAVVTAMGLVAAKIALANTDNAKATTEIDAIFADGVDGMFDDFDTAIADVQGDIIKAQNILGSGATPVTNAVNDLLVAASATVPADQQAIKYLDDDKIEHTVAAIRLGQARTQEAGTFVQSATAKISEAQTELQNIAGHVNAINPYASTVGNYIKEAIAYIQEAQGYVSEVQARLAQATAKRAEGSSRAEAGMTYLAEASKRLENGAAYLKEAQTAALEGNSYASEVQIRITRALGYARESSAWVEKASVQISECGVRIQTAQSYDQKSVMADRESVTLQQKFDRKLATYIGQFQVDPKQIFVRERRSR